MRVNIGDRIEKTKGSILSRLKDINDLNEQLKKDYVPLTVMNNLNQTIKDIDVSLFS